MIDGHKYIQGLSEESIRNLSLPVKFIVDFPLYFLFITIYFHEYSWIWVLGQCRSSCPPLESIVVKIENMTVILVISHWTAGNESFLKLLSLGSDSDNDTVAGRWDDFEADFRLSFKRQMLSTSDGMPRIFRTEFEKWITIHFKDRLMLIEPTQFYNGFFCKLRFNFSVSIFFLDLCVSLFDPFEHILLVGDKLDNASVFTKILKSHITLYTFFLFLSLFFFTTWLTNGMLVFAYHDWYSVMFVVGVLAYDTCESGIIHNYKIINCVLFVGFAIDYFLSLFRKDNT